MGSVQLSTRHVTMMEAAAAGRAIRLSVSVAVPTACAVVLCLFPSREIDLRNPTVSDVIRRIPLLQ